MDDSQILLPRAIKIQKGFQRLKRFIPFLAFTQMCMEVLYNASADNDSFLRHGSTQK